MDTTPISKADLLTLIRDSGRRFDAAIDAIEAARLTEPGVIDGLTIKDVIAHLTTWEERLLRWIERWQSTGRPERPEPGRTWDEMDAINDADFAAKAGLSLDAVRAATPVSRERVIAAVERLGEPDLIDESKAWDGLALATIVRWNTADHYDEHLEQIEAWLAAAS